MILNLETSYSDFGEANLQFTECHLFIGTNFDETKSFKVWGLTIHEDSFNTKEIIPYIRCEQHSAYYVSGYSIFSFENIIEARLSIALYNSNERGFIKNNDNQIVSITKNWGNASVHNSKDYQFGCVSDWPYGYCDLNIKTTGKAWLSLDTNNIITAQEYIMNVNKYGYDRGCV